MDKSAQDEAGYGRAGEHSPDSLLSSSERSSSAEDDAIETRGLQPAFSDEGSIISDQEGSHQGPMFSESEDEGTEGYRKGGYHMVHIGEVYHDRYKVLSKLGWGHFSTVWLCADMEYGGNLVAMKVQKSAQHYTEAAYDEIELLAEASKHVKAKAWRDTYPERQNGPCKCPPDFTGEVVLQNYFEHYGPNGKHACMIFEVMGPNVLAVIKRYNFKGIPLELVHKIAFHTLIGLDYLHRICGIIHTDLKPENVLVGCPLGIPVDKHGSPLIEPGYAKKCLKLRKDNRNSDVTKSASDRTQPQKTEDLPISGQTAFNAIPSEDQLAKLPRQERRKWKRKRARLEKRRKKQATQGEEGDKKKGEDKTGDKEQDSESASKRQGEDDSGAESESLSNSIIDPSPLAEPARKKMSPPPYCRPFLKPTRSDPTLLTTYDNESANLLLKPPYHHHLETLQRQFVQHKEETDHKRTLPPVKSDAQLARDCEEVLKLDLFNHPDVCYKIADLGNACWVQKHFSDEIQTRQYRSPEVIIGAGYDTSADMWSFACMIFELVTGDYLFDPKPSEEYPRDEDHLALCIELLGRMPKELVDRGRCSKTYFNSTGELRHIKSLRFWGLDDVCQQKYHMSFLEAKNLASFLLPMLTLNPKDRHTARQMLQHPWLKGQPSDDLLEYFHPRGGLGQPGREGEDDDEVELLRAPGHQSAHGAHADWINGAPLHPSAAHEQQLLLARNREFRAQQAELQNLLQSAHRPEDMGQLYNTLDTEDGKGVVVADAAARHAAHQAAMAAMRMEGDEDEEDEEEDEDEDEDDEDDEDGDTANGDDEKERVKEVKENDIAAYNALAVEAEKEKNENNEEIAAKEQEKVD